ncbi:MAG: DUF2189 domain-containing protein [Pseudomonadota bacterium]|nr:DUF2189 domain-containing protein [Pseudomonadota bacterium]
MAETAELRPRAPRINTLALADVVLALRRGVSDFLRAPLFGLFFGGIYAAGGLFVLYFLYQLQKPWLILPIAIGFPLIGPFVAVGLYETSRRLEAGEPLTWRGILTLVFQQRERELSWMAFVVLFVFWIWLYQVRLLTAIFLGFKSMSSVESFLRVVTGSGEGLTFLAVGTVVGGLLSLVLFSTTVIAIPLLTERDYDFVTAIITSVKTVTRNLLPMLAFGVVVAVLALLALVPAFLGLLVVLPVLGHATWHLYRRAIA